MDPCGLDGHENFIVYNGDFTSHLYIYLMFLTFLFIYILAYLFFIVFIFKAYLPFQPNNIVNAYLYVNGFLPDIKLFIKLFRFSSFRIIWRNIELILL